MKPRNISPSRLSFPLATALAALLTASSASGQTLFWDGNSTTANADGGTGNWDNNNLTNWDSLATAGANSVWLNSLPNSATFGGTAGTVSLTSAITAGGITFNTTAYVLASDTGTRTISFGAGDNTILFNNIASASTSSTAGVGVKLGGSGNVVLSTSNPATAGTLTLQYAVAGDHSVGWSGGTTINPGMTLVLNGRDLSLSSTSGITLNGGGVTLTNTTSAQGAFDRVNNSAGITSNSGTITYTNTSGSGLIYGETLGSVGLVRGQLNVAETTNMAGGGNIQTLTLSGLTRTGATNTSVVSFGSASGLNTTTNIIRVAGIATSTAAGQIVGPWSTYGTTPASPTDYAKYDSDGTFGRVLLAGISATAENSGSWVSGANVTLNGATSLTATRTVNTLRYTGGALALDLGVANNLESYGILNGGSGLTISTGGTGGLTTPTGGGYLYLTPGAAAITVNAPINDNGGAVTLVKSGSNTLTLGSTASNFSGGVVINAGTLATTENANLGSGGGITVNGAATWNAGAVTTTYNRFLTVNEGAVLSLASGNAGKTITGVLSGNGTIINTATTGFTFTNTGNTFTGTVNSGYQMDFASLGDSSNAINLVGSNSTFNWIGSAKTFSNRVFAIQSASTEPDINSNGTGALIIQQNLSITGAAGARTLNLGGSSTAINTFAGNIANGTGSVVGLTKNGSSVWALSGTNTYSGDTNLAAAFGLLIFQGSQSLSPNTKIISSQASSNRHAFRFLDDGAGTVNFNRPIEFGGTNTSQGLEIFVGNNNTANGGSGSGTTTGSTIQVGNITYTSIASDTTSWGINVTGANGYRLQTGTITLNNLTNLTAAQTHTTTLNPTTANMTVGAITMSAGNVTANDGIPVLSLGGTSSDNIVTGAISNASDFATGRVLSLTKANSSTWTLQGTNTYTGTTTVTGGKLLLSSASSLASGSAVTVSGGALGGTGTVNGAVSLTTAGGIDLRDGAVGTLTLASTLAINGAAGANLLSFDFGNGTGTSDLLSVADTTSVTTTGAAVISINQLGGMAGVTNGTYTLIGGAGTLDATNFAKFSLASTSFFGKTLALVHDSVTENGNLQLIVANGNVGDAVNNHFWKGNTSVWNTAQWYSNSGATVTATAPGYNSNVVFAASSPGNLTNTLGADYEINSLTVNSGLAATSISGNALTIAATSANGNTAGNGITVNNTTGTTIASRLGLGSSQTWTVASSGTLTVSGAVTDYGAGFGLTKAGAGTLTLTGANTFSGGTVISGGLIRLNSEANLGDTAGDITFSGSGGLQLNSGSSLTYGLDRTITVDGGATAFFGDIGINSAITTQIDGKITGSGSLHFGHYQLGSAIANLTHASSDFTGFLRIGGTSSFGGTTYSGYTVNAASLVDGSGYGNIIFGQGNGSSGNIATFNWTGAAPLVLDNRQIQLDQTVEAAKLGNNTTDPANTITVNTNLTVSRAGAKTFTLGGTNIGTNTFVGTINDSASPVAAISLTKADAGTWIISNTANTYSGATTISGGILSVSTLASAGSNSSIGAFATSGATGLLLSGGTLRYTGGSVTTNRGFTLTANSGINLGGASAANLTLGNSQINNGAGIMLAVTGTAGSTLTIGDVNNLVSGTNPWTIDPSINVTVSGVISGIGGVARRNGVGAVTLNNDSNSFTGPINTNANATSGALFFTSIADYGTNSALGRGTSGTAYTLGGNQGGAAPLTYIGSGNSSSNRQIDLGASASIVNNGSGTLTFTGLVADSNKFIRALQTTGARTLTLGGTYTGAANVISGNIANNGGTATVALAKSDAGTWALSGTNTYTGTTVVNAGTLQFAKMASLYNSTTGSWTPANINVKAGATLSLNVDSAGTSGFDAANLNTLLTSISVAGSATAGLQAGATLGLDTSTATGGTFTQGNVIANSTGTNGGAIGLTKLGTGTLVLDKTNTYSGMTRVSAGTLALGANDVFLDTTPVSIGSATLNASTFTDTVGTLDPTGAAIINLGTGGALAFADSSTVDWTGGSINITGTLGTTSIRFGTTSGGLTSGQLAVISVNGSGAGTYTLDADGYLVSGGPDTTPPTLTSIVDNVSGGPVDIGATVTYTVTFNEDIDAASVTSADFNNNGTAGITVGAINETSSGVFTVAVTANSAGSLKLRIPTGAVIEDVALNDLVVPVEDDTTITVHTLFDTWANATYVPPLTMKLAGDDQDGDTFINLMEFAFGTHPTVSSSGSIVWVNGGAVTTPGQPVAINMANPGVDYRAVFGRRKDYAAAGLTYTVEFSAGLNVWVPSAVTPTVLTGAGGLNPSEIEAVSVPYPLLIDVGGNNFKKPTFFRLTISN
jgi:autotransporter-associated beta strand protein